MVTGQIDTCIMVKRQSLILESFSCHCEIRRTGLSYTKQQLCNLVLNHKYCVKIRSAYQTYS